MSIPGNYHTKNTALRAGNLSAGRQAVSGRRPSVAYLNRGSTSGHQMRDGFSAPELWHEPSESGRTKFIQHSAGEGFVHPVTVDEIRDRLQQLPSRFVRGLEVVQLSQMTRKRRRFPCYGMQWGSSVYLYPIESSLIEEYVTPPRPSQIIEAEMFGGVWSQHGNRWRLTWTSDSIRDFYLNDVLIHEIGHLVDQRNTRSVDRERYANWFAIEYGYRFSRGLSPASTVSWG